MRDLRFTIFSFFIPAMLLSQTTSKTYLEVNLGVLPVDFYETTTPAANYYPNSTVPDSPTLSPKCGAMSVRACMQTALAYYGANSVTGVRVMIGLCGGGWSSAFSLSANGPASCSFNTSQSRPYFYVRDAWYLKVNDFLADVKAAGISNVSLDFQLYEFGNPLVSPATGLANACDNNNFVPASRIRYDPTAPFPSIDIGVSPTQEWVPWGFLNPQAYNCAPENPYFIGWSALNNALSIWVYYAQVNRINLSEFEWQQEIDIVNSSVAFRFVYDNKCQLHGGCYVPYTSGQQAVMFDYFQYGAPPLIVPAYNKMAYSTVVANSNVAASSFPSTSCTSLYGEDSRVILASALVAGLRGGKFGLPGPAGATAQDGFWCGGNSNSSILAQAPVVFNLPPQSDFHSYPQNLGEISISQPAIIEDARRTFNAIRSHVDNSRTIHAQPLYSSRRVIIGETHGNSYYNTTSTLRFFPNPTICDPHVNSCNPVADGREKSCENSYGNIKIGRDYASWTYTGFLQSTLIGTQPTIIDTILRPWQFPQSHCFPFPRTGLHSIYVPRP